MILKKPYAFLIKHFKVIHLVITVLLCLCVYQAYSIHQFFNAYVQNSYTTSVTIGLAEEYVPLSFYLEILGIIALVVIIIVLLVHKKKPNIVYFFMAIYYVAFLVFLVYISTVLKGFEYALLESTSARTIRDVSLMIAAPQVIFIIYMGLRAFGANLKQFNFNQDLKELAYSENDDDEVEISINFDAYKAKRNARRVLREMIYYVQENKLIVGIIGVVVVIVCLYFGYSTSSTNFDNNYKVGSMFTYQNLNITIKDTIISNLDYKGFKINEGKYYLALKINVQNNYGDSIVLDYNNFKLNVGGVTLLPSNNFVKNFLDYNSPIVPAMYTPNINKDVLLIYELNEKLINKRMKLQLYNGSTYQNGTYYPKNIYIKINPRVIDDISIVGNYIFGNEIKLDETFLGNSTIKTEDIKLSKNQLYTYTACDTKGECKEYKDMITASMSSGRSGNDILLINAQLNLDKDSEYAKNYGSYYSFAEHFITIQYKVGDKVVSNGAINVTPDQEGINFFAFEVPAEMQKAQVVQAIVTVRNKRYIINLQA